MSLCAYAFIDIIPCAEDVEAAWATEIAARVQAYENGQTAVFDAQRVFREARA